MLLGRLPGHIAVTAAAPPWRSTRREPSGGGRLTNVDATAKPEAPDPTVGRSVVVGGTSYHQTRRLLLPLLVAAGLLSAKRPHRLRSGGGAAAFKGTFS